MADATDNSWLQNIFSMRRRSSSGAPKRRLRRTHFRFKVYYRLQDSVRPWVRDPRHPNRKHYITINVERACAFIQPEAKKLPQHEQITIKQMEMSGLRWYTYEDLLGFLSRGWLLWFELA